MKSNLNIEWLKLKNYMVFKVLAILFIAGIVIVNYIVYIVNKNMITKSSAGAMLTGAFSPYNFDLTWQSTTYATGFILIFPAVMLIILITNEYHYRTHRQNIIDGWSRKEFIDVKIALAFIIAAVTTIAVFLVALTFGWCSGTPFSMNGFSHLGYFFIKAVSYNMFGVLIAVLVRRTGFAIGLCFIYLVAENMLSFFFDYLGIKTRDNFGWDLGSVGDYLPLSSSDALLTFPDNPLKSAAKSTLPTEYFWVTVAFAAAYFVLFIWWSRKKFIRSDL